MPDPRFYLSKGPIGLDAAVSIAGARLLGKSDPAVRLDRVAGVEADDLTGAVVYVEDDRRAMLLNGRTLGLCLAPEGFAGTLALRGGAVAVAATPRAAFGAVASALHEPRPLAAGAAARIASDAQVDPRAVIGAEAEIGSGAQIGPHAVIGPGVVIGARTVVAENASIWCAIVGADARIGAGAAIGGPGFGFSPGAKGLERLPQLGRAFIGDRVEIGSNSCVDRGALGDTRIGAGTKIDNLVQIAHNVRIGDNCVIAAMVGIAGSTVIGDRVMLGGHAGVADHLTIGDDARIAAKSGVTSDVPAGETWGGYPARPRMVWLRQTAAAARMVADRKKKATDHDD